MDQPSPNWISKCRLSIFYPVIIEITKQHNGVWRFQGSGSCMNYYELTGLLAVQECLLRYSAASRSGSSA